MGLPFSFAIFVSFPDEFLVKNLDHSKLLHRALYNTAIEGTLPPEWASLSSLRYLFSSFLFSFVVVVVVVVNFVILNVSDTWMVLYSKELFLLNGLLSLPYSICILSVLTIL